MALVIQILRVCWSIIERQNCYDKTSNPSHIIYLQQAYQSNKRSTDYLCCDE